MAELYVGDSHASIPRPVKELKAFAKVELKAGETKRVTLTLDRRAFSFYDINKKDWSAEPGDFTILVGGASDDIQLAASLFRPLESGVVSSPRRPGAIVSWPVKIALV